MDTTWSALVIDDDPGLRQSVRLCLEADQRGYWALAPPPGALEALDRGRFDVVFLDLWLQSESGLDLLPEILRRQPGVGIIVITAFATFETAVEAMKRGAVDYLPKPFTPEQVRHAARRVVAANVLKRQVSELRERLDEAEAESFFETAQRRLPRLPANGGTGGRLRFRRPAPRRERHGQDHARPLDAARTASGPADLSSPSTARCFPAT